MLVLESLVRLHRTVQLQLLSIIVWGTDLDFCDTEWFALETNRDHSELLSGSKTALPHSASRIAKTRNPNSLE